jgi:hypothetical protein
MDDCVALSLEARAFWPVRSTLTSALTMLSVSIPEPIPPNVIVPTMG